MSSTRSKPFRDLAGKMIGWWYVVSYEGLRGGVRQWRCLCRGDLLERVVSEPDIRTKRINALYLPCRCFGPQGNLIGCIIGHLTVVERTSYPDSVESENSVHHWKCRCTCGNEKEISEKELTSRKTLSCGCRAGEEIRAVLKPIWQKARVGLDRAIYRARADHARSREDAWTPPFEKALRIFQPLCVICGETKYLTTDHVRPANRGHGLMPGNAVRICRSCNSFKNDKEFNDLAPEDVEKLLTAATDFEAYWKRGCVPRISGERIDSPLKAATLSLDEVRKKVDFKVIALLRAIGSRGDDASINSLADWLEKHSDPRANLVREVTKHTSPDLGHVVFARDYQDLVRFQRAEKVWKILRLSMSQRTNLILFLEGVTIDELAQRDKVMAQTIRFRIKTALSKLPGKQPSLSKDETTPAFTRL